MFPDSSDSLLSQAFSLAEKLHREQFRKTISGTVLPKIPYISHLMRVAGLVQEYGGNTEITIAALLHDAVEDQGGMATAELIARQFGDQVKNYVLECSDSIRPKNQEKLPWRERKLRYLDHLKVASEGALLISACDKLDNLASLIRTFRAEGPDCFNRFKTGKEGYLWYLQEVLNVLELRQNPVFPELQTLWQILLSMISQSPSQS